MHRHHRHLILLVIGLVLNACSVSLLERTHQPSLVSGTATISPTVPTDLLADVRQRGVLRIATDANYNPQSFQRMDGTWQGFDIEVGREIAKRLGVRAEFLDIPFNVVTVGNWRDRWDVHIGSMTITTARQQQLLFSLPYYYTPAIFAVHTSSSVQRIENLRNARVGVASSTTYFDYLNNKLTLANGQSVIAAPPTTIQAYETDQLALQDLAQNQLDAVVTALPTVRDAISKGEPLRIINPPVFYEELAVALDRRSSRSSVPLASEISNVIQAMHQDGTLTRLSQQFYNVDITVKTTK